MGFIELAPKAWMVKTTHSISLLNLRKGYPSAESVSQNETYFCAPQKNVWWNRDTNMKTARQPLWNLSRFRETAGAVKNKRAPDVRLVESGHQNQTRRLAQRFCWLEPAVPPLLPPTHLPLSSPFSSSPRLHSSCPFFFILFHFFFLSSLPFTLSPIPPPSPRNSPALSFWLLFHTSICELLGDNRGWGGLVRRFFELEQLLWVMAIHLPLSAPYTSIVGFRRWFIYTLTENYTWRTVWVASHVASLFSLRHRVAQVNTFNSEVALFKPLEVKSLNSILAAIITSRSRKSYFSHIHNFNSPVWSPKFFIARLKCPPSLNHTFPSPRELSTVLLWHLARAWGPVHERFEAFHTLFLWFCKAAVFA